MAAMPFGILSAHSFDSFSFTNPSLLRHFVICEDLRKIKGQPKCRATLPHAIHRERHE
jgi:hypothetical protein